MARFEGIGMSSGNYGSRDVGERIFGGENTVQTQMRVEAALAKVQAAAGIIPQEAADEIVRKCDQSLIDEERYREQIRVTGGHPLVALVRLYGDLCEGDAGQYVHYGTTTQDILDTAYMLQLKQAYEVIQEKAAKLREVVAALARKHRSTVVMGRTNDQHALPITLGFRMASWVDELDRSIQRLSEDKERIFVGQFGGAVGTLASLEDKGLAVRDGLMRELGLNVPAIAWYSARDRMVEMCGDVCILMGAMGRIGNEVYNASRTEINEYAEGFRMGKVGSSTMPHKRNPFQSARIVTNARLSRSIMADALNAMDGTYERDARPLAMEAEFQTRCFLLADGTLDLTIDLMEKLEVHAADIRRNLDQLHGLVFAETVMMALADRYGRLEAHEMVYQAAQKAISEQRSFREVLLEDPEIGKAITADELNAMMIPEQYIGLSEYFVDQICGAND